MRKLQIQEGMQKIKEGGEKQGVAEIGQVWAEKMEKERKDKMLKMFEDEVIVKETTNKPKDRSKSREKVSHKEKISVKVMEDEDEPPVP
jgi:hypothetical protein